MAVERRPVKGGPVDGCARGCGACGIDVCPRRRPFTVKELLSLPKLPVGRIYLDSVSPVRQGGGEPPIRKSEKICSICKEAASTCSHSDLKQSIPVT